MNKNMNNFKHEFNSFNFVTVHSLAFIFGSVHAQHENKVVSRHDIPNRKLVYQNASLRFQSQKKEKKMKRQKRKKDQQRRRRKIKNLKNNCSVYYKFWLICLFMGMAVKIHVYNYLALLVCYQLSPMSFCNAVKIQYLNQSATSTVAFTVGFPFVHPRCSMGRIILRHILRSRLQIYAYLHSKGNWLTHKLTELVSF